MQTIGTGLPAQPGQFGQLGQQLAQPVGQQLGLGQGLGQARGLAPLQRPLGGVQGVQGLQGLQGGLAGAQAAQPDFGAFQRQQAAQRLVQPQGVVPAVQPQLQTTTVTTVKKPAAGCEGRTFQYMLGFAVAAFLLSILLGILLEYWISGTNCITKSMFGSLVFYSFIVAVLVAIVTFVAHRIYCKS